VYKIIVLVAVISFSYYSFFEVYAQSESPQLATFQESAQILIDQQLSNNVTASITLQSTSNQEIRIPSEFEQSLFENDRIIAVVLTNVEQCVLGVFNEACILVNVSRDESEKGIIEIQDAAREIGDSVIDSINQVFDTDAKFNSAFVHHKDETNISLDTSGVISGRGTISAVYTMPKEDTHTMYEKISTILIPSVIRDSGGFYEIATKLSTEDTATMTFSIIPKEELFLYQLKLSVDYPNSASNIEIINPLEFLKSDELERSSYFSGGFYPLNSILNVVILSSESTNVNEVNTNMLQTQIINEEKFPIDLSQDGWFFDPESGNKIDGKYLFGKKFSISKNELIFTLGDAQINGIPPEETTDFDESILILIIIVIISVGAAAFYLKGYKKKV